MSNPLLKQAIFRDAANDRYIYYVHIYTDSSKDPTRGKFEDGYIESPLFSTELFCKSYLSDHLSVFHRLNFWSFQLL